MVLVGRFRREPDGPEGEQRGRDVDHGVQRVADDRDGAEVATGAALVAADGYVFAPGHAFSIAQSLGTAWPLAGIFAAAVAFGAGVGTASGVLFGLARIAAAYANGVHTFHGSAVLSL